MLEDRIKELISELKWEREYILDTRPKSYQAYDPGDHFNDGKAYMMEDIIDRLRTLLPEPTS